MANKTIYTEPWCQEGQENIYENGSQVAEDCSRHKPEEDKMDIETRKRGSKKIQLLVACLILLTSALVTICVLFTALHASCQKQTDELRACQASGKEERQITESRTNPVTSTFSTEETLTTALANSRTTCPPDWKTDNTGQCYYLSRVGASWEDAQDSCRKMRANLMTINDVTEHAFLWRIGRHVSGIWIGLSDRNIDGMFEWVDETTSTYTNWLLGEPKRWFAARCVEASHGAIWRVQTCSKYLQYVCEKGTQCPPGWHHYSTKCYYLSNDTASWENAQQRCESHGANLTTIDDIAEHSFLWEIGKDFVLWIGLNDRNNESLFEWVDGAPNVYTDWHPGEPNGGTWENCVEMWYGSSWNDKTCTTANRYVCEKDQN